VLVGGALSNLVDRLLLGAVRDFLAVAHVVVNLADLAVLAGLVGYGLTRSGAMPAYRSHGHQRDTQAALYFGRQACEAPDPWDERPSC
jgi:hypothetical protein